jgi:hypothetical protein
MPGTPPIFVPSAPKTATVTSSSASFGVVIAPFFTLHTTVAAFFRVDGVAATATGASCFFIAAGASIDMYANPGTVVTIIAAGTTTGNAYITEWV